MRTHRQVVAGTEATIHVLERRADLDDFQAFLSRGDEVLALDTETTKPDLYAVDHRLLAVRFGTEREAWVLPCNRFAEDVKRALRHPRPFVAYGATEHRLALDRHLGVRLKDVVEVFDVRILAHLLDPRDETRARPARGQVLGH